MNMTKVVFLVVVVILVSEAANVQRLETRVRILEDKVHHNSVTFQEDLDQIFGILNTTSQEEPTSKINGMNEMQHEGLSYLVGNLSSFQNVVTNQMHAVKRGFAEEKKWLRVKAENLNTDVKRMKREISMDLQIIGNTTDMIQSGLDTICQPTEKKLDSVLERVSELENAGGATQSLQQTIDDILKSINTISERQNDMEKMIDNVSGNTKLLFKLTTTTFPKFVSFQSSYYFIVEDNMSWMAAKKSCEGEGAYLAEVNSEEEHDFLTDIVVHNSTYGNNGYFWLGGNDIAQEGKWIWSHSNTQFTVDYWRKQDHEPNGGREENCLHMYSIHEFWNDVACSSSYLFPICEISLQP